jgi:hypothetical protein
MAFRFRLDPRWALAFWLAWPCVIGASLTPAAAQQRPVSYTADEILLNGHRFFGSLSKGLAQAVEAATRRWGRPNGYILGQEAGGALVGGVRYGEGVLYTRNAGDKRVFWQGPTIGFDAGGDGDRTMILVYNMPAKDAIFQRFAGVDGSAYMIGGFGMTALAANDIVLVPIRTGLGARLGVNVGDHKYTDRATWNPFQRSWPSAADRNSGSPRDGIPLSLLSMPRSEQVR